MTDWLIVGWLVLIQVQLWLQGRLGKAHTRLFSDVVTGFLLLCQDLKDFKKELTELKDGKDGK